MATNAIPKLNGQILFLASRMTKGLATLGTSLGITQVDPREFAAAEDAFRHAESDYCGRRGERTAIYADFHEKLAAMDAWLNAVRNVLRTRFGASYSIAWVQAGFINNTISLPTGIANRISLTQAVINFLEKTPSFQVADLEVTPAEGTLVYDAVNAADREVKSSEVAMKDAGESRATARAVLVGLMRKVIGILRVTLSAADTRWLAFGLNIPAARTTPAAPKDLRAERSAAGLVVLNCEATPLAESYRWRVRIAGMDSKFRLAGRSTQPCFNIADPAPVPGWS